jgi:hypothetical protein
MDPRSTYDYLLAMQPRNAYDHLFSDEYNRQQSFSKKQKSTFILGDQFNDTVSDKYARSGFFAINESLARCFACGK